MWVVFWGSYPVLLYRQAHNVPYPAGAVEESLPLFKRSLALTLSVCMDYAPISHYRDSGTNHFMDCGCKAANNGHETCYALFIQQSSNRAIEVLLSIDTSTLKHQILLSPTGNVP